MDQLFTQLPLYDRAITKQRLRATMGSTTGQTGPMGLQQVVTSTNVGARMGMSDAPLETLRRVRDEGVNDARRVLVEAQAQEREAKHSLQIEQTKRATLEQERLSLELAPGSRVRVSELSKLELRRLDVDLAIRTTIEGIAIAQRAVEKATRAVDEAEKLVAHALVERQVVDGVIDERSRVIRAQNDERADEDALDTFRVRTAS